MNHESWMDKIYELRDGALPPAEAQAAETHLKDCADCRATLQEWEHFSRRALVPLRAEASASFVQSVMARLSNSPRLSFVEFLRQIWKIPVLGFGVAGAVLVLLSSLLPIRQSPTLEAMLLADGQEGHASEWVFQSQNPESEELLAMVLEEQ